MYIFRKQQNNRISLKPIDKISITEKNEIIYSSNKQDTYYIF